MSAPHLILSQDNQHKRIDSLAGRNSACFFPQPSGSIPDAVHRAFWWQSSKAEKYHPYSVFLVAGFQLCIRAGAWVLFPLSLFSAKLVILLHTCSIHEIKNNGESSACLCLDPILHRPGMKQNVNYSFFRKVFLLKFFNWICF